MSILSINLVVLRSRDLDAAVAFYTRLGIRFSKHKHGNGSEHFAAEIGGSVFELYPLAPNGPVSSGTRIGFTVSSLAEAVASLSEYPNAILSPPMESEWGLRAVIVDPDGHSIELVQR